MPKVYHTGWGDDYGDYLKEREVEELERHNAEMEEHKRLERDEKYRHNRAMEISYLATKEQVREMKRYLMLQKELCSIASSISSTIEQFAYHAIYHDDRWLLGTAIRNGNKQHARFNETDENKCRAAAYALERAPEAMDYICCMLYAKRFICNAIEQAPLYNETVTQPANENEADTVLLKGVDADEFLAQRVVKLVPKEVIAGVLGILNSSLRMPEEERYISLQRFRGEQRITFEHSIIGDMKSLHEDIPYMGLEFPKRAKIACDETFESKPYFIFDRKIEVIADEILSEAFDICKHNAIRFGSFWDYSHR